KIYVYYTARNQAGVSYIGVAIADDTRFHFVDYGVVVEWGTEAIDAFILEDNGDLYISWKAYGLDDRPIELIACKLSPDGLKPDGEPFSLMRDDEHIGMEGQHWFKSGDYYHILYSVKSCCGPGSDYEVYAARSKNLRGPYEKYTGNPILKGDGKDVLSCGHGTFTTTPDGRTFYLFHAYLTGSNFYGGRQGMVQEMVIDQNEWPAFTTGNEVKLIQPTPLPGTVQQAVVPIQDNFRSATLAPYWSWNYPFADIDVEIKNESLYLAGIPKGNTKSGTALCVRPVVPDYSYETQVIQLNSSLKGLTFYGDADNLIIWGYQNNYVQLKEIKEGKEQILYETDPCTVLPFLKTEIKDGTYATFYWSSDGTEWEQVPVDKNGRDLSPLVRWDRVARPGLYHQGPTGEPGIFQYFNMEYKTL
ncbi:MAG: family 43 glycosylhydrolase, partial [Tannerellaceae bacterium]|nr:family 43 glycosylhydrolase [Tannerellaceae bacterium]